MIILTTSLSVASVGLVETLLTAQLVDGMTNELNDKNADHQKSLYKLVVQLSD